MTDYFTPSDASETLEGLELDLDGFVSSSQLDTLVSDDSYNSPKLPESETLDDFDDLPSLPLKNVHGLSSPSPPPKHVHFASPTPKKKKLRTVHPSAGSPGPSGMQPAKTQGSSSKSKKMASSRKSKKPTFSGKPKAPDSIAVASGSSNIPETPEILLNFNELNQNLFATPDIFTDPYPGFDTGTFINSGLAFANSSFPTIPTHLHQVPTPPDSDPIEQPIIMSQEYVNAIDPTRILLRSIENLYSVHSLIKGINGLHTVITLFTHIKDVPPEDVAELVIQMRDFIPQTANEGRTAVEQYRISIDDLIYASTVLAGRVEKRMDTESDEIALNNLLINHEALFQVEIYGSMVSENLQVLLEL